MTRLFNGGRGGEGLHMIKLELFRNPYFFNNLARSFFLLCLRSCLLKLSFLHNPVLPVKRKKRTVNSIRFQWIKICRSRLWIIKHWSSALSDHIRSMKQKEVTEKTQKNTARREWRNRTSCIYYTWWIVFQFISTSLQRASQISDYNFPFKYMFWASVISFQRL